MKKCLVTGFMPFGGETINPSYEAVKNLENELFDYQIFKKEISTTYQNSHLELIQYIKEINPDIVILVGQAGGTKHIRLERIAINIDDAVLPDNNGLILKDKPIIKHGKNAYFSTLPLRKIEHALKQHNYPVIISNTAGTYVCNHLMYHLLSYLDQNGHELLAGFIHVPYSNEQTLDKPDTFSMSLTEITDALTHVIETTIKAVENEILIY